MKETTAKGIISRYKKNGSVTVGHIGGHKAHIISGTVGDDLISFVEEYPDSTLLEMKCHLAEKDCHASLATISRYLSGKLITSKLMRITPAQRNSERTIEKRFDYAQQIVQNGLPFSSMYYIDECGFNIWLHRSYGRSRKGERAYRAAHGQRGRNISLCLAISVSGVVLSRIIEGAFDRAKFQDFITELDSVVPEHKVLVMDNCRIYYSVNSTTHELRYLPPYSPFLNPIESFFSQLKNGIRSRLRGANLEAMEQLQRREFLKQAIQSELDQLHNYDNLARYSHSASFYSCLQKATILGD